MSLSEFELIAQIFAAGAARQATDAGVVLGIGDDAALLRATAGHELVVAVDTLVDTVHFPADLAAVDIAWRALAVNLSDLAAMGATPRWFTLALTLPAADEPWLREFAHGLFDLATCYRTTLVGGDTTRGPLSISIQVIGEVPAGLALRRSGARPGDRVYVSGRPGLAALGLRHWQQGNRHSEAAVKFRRPEPRVVLGQALRGIASAAIDISDGLWADLEHVLIASRVGAQLDGAALCAIKPDAEISEDDWQQLVLGGGDDYELCFTAAPASSDTIAGLAAELDIELVDIGEIRTEGDVSISGLLATPASLNHGYRHF